MAGVHLSINPCRVQDAFFHRPAGYEAPHPVIADFINATYFRPEIGNLTLVGLKDPAETDAMVDPDGYFQSDDDDLVLEAGEGLIKHFLEYSIVG